MDIQNKSHLDMKPEISNDTLHLNNSAFDPNTDHLYIPLYIYISVSIVNAAIFIFGTFGNILVIISIVKVRGMLTPTNVFLLNLSLADILVLMICQPSGLLEFFGKDRWFLGKTMCKLVPMIENGVLQVSILTMVAVALERYNALCHPFNGRLSYTISSAIKTIIGIWILGSLFSVPFIIMSEHEDAIFFDGKDIKVCRTKVNERWKYIYTIVIVIVFFLIPLVILICIYSKIIKQLTSDKFRSLRGPNRGTINTCSVRKQVVKMLILIIVLFFVALFPIRTVTLWLIFAPSDNVTKIGLEAFLNLMAWTRIFMYTNSAGNPIIYSLTSTKFKMAFLKVLGRKVDDRRSAYMYRYTKGLIEKAEDPRRREHIGNIHDIRREEDRPYFTIRLVLSPDTR